MDTRIIIAVLLGAILAPLAWPVMKAIIAIVGLGTLIFLFLTWSNEND